MKRENEKEDNAPEEAAAKKAKVEEDKDEANKEDDEDEDDDDEDDDDDKEDLKFAVVCRCNMNRSMEAHRIFVDSGLDVLSFGVGNKVRLPAPDGSQLNFEFDEAYTHIKDEVLKTGDVSYYRDKGILEMLDRNIDIKDHPERFQDFTDAAQFNIIFCFEEAVYDILVKDIKSRQPEEYKQIHVLNLDVKDDHKEAKKGAQVALELCKKCVEKSDDLDDSLPAIIGEVEKAHGRPLIHMTHYL